MNGFRVGAIAFLLALTSQQAAAAPSMEEMWSIMQRQQQELELLRNQVVQLRAQNDELNQKADAAVAAAEATQAQGGGASNWVANTTLGGYGELHYNNLEGTKPTGTGNADKKEIDFHRFVLFLNHEFNDRIRLFSELELEHSLAGEGKPGEVELEQAYIEFDLNERHRAKAGLFLIPVGLLNETHEPNTFYGVERNPVEKNIIPTTWWAGGAGLSGQLGGGFSYDLALHEGLSVPLTGSSAFKIRSGRQKTAEASARDTAATARLKYTGIPGLELGASYQHQADIAQGTATNADGANLIELHTAWQRGAFGFRALWAEWNLQGAGPEAIGRDRQSGWYAEPSWRLNEKFGMFARYNLYDNEAGDSVDSEKEQINFGFNYWPHPNVVLKADYEIQDFDDGTEASGFNLGVGYQF